MRPYHQASVSAARHRLAFGLRAGEGCLDPNRADRFSKGAANYVVALDPRLPEIGSFTDPGGTEAARRPAQGTGQVPVVSRSVGVSSLAQYAYGLEQRRQRGQLAASHARAGRQRGHYQL